MCSGNALWEPVAASGVSSSVTVASRAARRQEAGFTPNVVVYTTMLKGCCNTGDVEKATTFLHDMAVQVPPVRCSVGDGG